MMASCIRRIRREKIRSKIPYKVGANNHKQTQSADTLPERTIFQPTFNKALLAMRLQWLVIIKLSVVNDFSNKVVRYSTKRRHTYYQRLSPHVKLLFLIFTPMPREPSADIHFGDHPESDVISTSASALGLPKWCLHCSTSGFSRCSLSVPRA